MVWKMKSSTKHKKTPIESSWRSVDSRSTGTLVSKTPKKGCLRMAENPSDSDWSKSGSSVSTHHSETFRHDQSSLNTTVSSQRSSSNSSSSNGSSLARSWVPYQASESLDARLCAKARGQPSSHASSERTSSLQGLVGVPPTYSGDSQKNKSVRFSVVEIRDYEREIADNPSCSNGAPIGIGWSHLDSRVVHLNHYENSRPYRKGQLEMVLTREEREVLLKEWGVSEQEIVSSTRALNKAKNQRRQTVRNLNKVERVEAGIENAARKLMRVFTLKRSTKSEVEELQRQADVAVSMIQKEMNDSASQEDELDYERKAGQQAPSSLKRLESMEDESDVLGSFEVKLSQSVAGASPSPPDSFVRTVATTSVSREELDAMSCISGFTLGNSTTASALEIERFHRELELEMFGDQLLPSMVGQTLEVDVNIPEEDKMYSDPSPNGGSQEPPSVVASSSWDQGSESAADRKEWSRYQVQSTPGQQLEHVQLPTGMQTRYNVCDNATFRNYQLQMQNQHDVAKLNTLLERSLDSCGMEERGAFTSPTNPHFLPPTPQRHEEIDSRSYWSSGARMERSPYSTAPLTEQRNSPGDGPRVTHIPLASHLSPNNWMDGPTTNSRRRNQSDAIVISEDDVDMDVHFVEQRPQHHHIAML